MSEQEEIWALVARGGERLVAAKVLLQSGLYPDAVSRAYYAMFDSARALLLSRDQSYVKYSAVNSAFGEHFSKTGLAPPHLHRALLDMQEDRRSADYDSVVEIEREDAEKSITAAEEMLAFAKDYLKKL